jgi:hypothetical protein
MRAPRGYSCPFLLGREAMASLLAACRKNFPAACGFHARTKPVRLGPASLTRLICTLWQNNPPSFMRAHRTHRVTAMPRSASTHGPPQRTTPNHQVYLPSRRRVKNPWCLRKFPSEYQSGRAPLSTLGIPSRSRRDVPGKSLRARLAVMGV